MFADDFVQRVAQCAQEILVCFLDGAVQVELDDGLRLADGGKLPLIVCALQFLGGHVRREFDDFLDLTV